MDRIIDYVINEQDLAHPGKKGLRVEQFLRRKGYSAHTLARLRQMLDSILVNGVPVHMHEVLKAGDRVTVCIHEMDVSDHVEPVNLPLDIVYEDEDLIVVNKPAGMPIHPSAKNRDNSLASALAFYYQSQGKPFVFRCCNRLDKDTSGLTLVAKHFLSGSLISDMGKRREIHREYLGIVRGDLCEAGLELKGTIDVPLSRKPGSIIERVPDPEKGERAVTHYQVLDEKNGYSLLRFVLETGRTHQIRIHMKTIGFPLVGDPIYNPSVSARTSAGEVDTDCPLHRQALHAYRLSFLQPLTGGPLSFTAPLPEDMAGLLR